MRKILQYTLRILARIMLWRYRPKIIAITGSVGKTSTKDAVFAVLDSSYRVRKSTSNLNTEIGVPLTILGIGSSGKNIFGWFLGFFRVLVTMLLKRNYPEILILELGAARPGDIRYFTEFIKPQVGVVTAIGEIPVHVEFFSGPQAVAREKSNVIRILPVAGAAVLNYDDEVVYEMCDKTKARVLSFGFGEGADIRVVHYESKLGEVDGDKDTGGVIFKVHYEGNVVPFRLLGVFGKQQVYAALAGVAVGLALGMNLVRISRALENYSSPPGRMRLLRGIKGTWIIDDTYNAAPMSMMAALETLGELPAARKIAVLGDMLEIGKYTVEAHESIGEEAVRMCDYLFTVGQRAKFIHEEARKRGMGGDHIFHFNESQEAGLPLERFLKPGDLVLVKGSRAMKMEKVVEEILRDPEKQKEFLVHR